MHLWWISFSKGFKPYNCDDDDVELFHIVENNAIAIMCKRFLLDQFIGCFDIWKIGFWFLLSSVILLLLSFNIFLFFFQWNLFILLFPEVSFRNWFLWSITLPAIAKTFCQRFCAAHSVIKQPNKPNNCLKCYYFLFGTIILAYSFPIFGFLLCFSGFYALAFVYSSYSERNTHGYWIDSVYFHIHISVQRTYFE